MDERTRQRLLNPPAGSALARARDYGIDLTMLVRNAERTPEQRVRAAFSAMQSFEWFRKAGRHRSIRRRYDGHRHRLRPDA